MFLSNISHFSSTDCSEVMSKRTQQNSGEERVTAKWRPMMSLVARVPSTLSVPASESPGKKSCERQSPWSAKAEKKDRPGQPVVDRDVWRGRGSVDAWYTTAWDTEECVGSVEDDHVHVFVADVVTSFDTIDGDLLDCVLSRLGLPGWFRGVYFELHADVRLRLVL